MKKQCSHCKKFKYLNEFGKNKNTFDGLTSWCLICKRKENNLGKKRLAKNKPWYTHYEHAKSRCNNPNNDKYKFYGGRGIKCLITEDEIKKIWFRDKAHKMDKPSIDRIDNNGNYCLENCRFIELRENNLRNKLCKPILQFDLNGNFIKEWESINFARQKLKIYNIHRNLINKSKHAGTFIWKYKIEVK